MEFKDTNERTIDMELGKKQIDAIRKQDREQAHRYIVWGVITVLINISIFYLLAHTLGINYQMANFFAWILSAQCSFWFDKLLVFQHKSEHVAKDMGKFYGTRILTFFVESLFLWLGISVFGFHKVITKIIGHGIAVICNYFLSKLVVFEKVLAEDSI